MVSTYSEKGYHDLPAWVALMARGTGTGHWNRVPRYETLGNTL